MKVDFRENYVVFPVYIYKKKKTIFNGKVLSVNVRHDATMRNGRWAQDIIIE